jgi:hypothetical protein
MDTEKQRLDPRRREAHPERILVGDETFIRNDKLAEEYGVSERSIDRGDRDGAAFRFIGGVKYRPKRRYDQFILNSIQEGRPRAPSRKRRRTAPPLSISSAGSVFTARRRREERGQ